MADMQNGAPDSTVPDYSNGSMPVMDNGQLNGMSDVNGFSAAPEALAPQVDFTNSSFVPALPVMADPAVEEVQTISAGMHQKHRSSRRPLTTLVPDEIALYDRQIRLWGVKAQEK